MKLFIKAAVLFIFLTAVINSVEGQPKIPYSVIANGGDKISGGNYTVSGTIGQLGIGSSSSTNEITLGGFWYILTKTVVSADEKDIEIPLIFQLYQNYPNPFNPATIIKFSVAERAFTQIKLYNILGSEITSLVNEELEPGNYELKFTATDLASGIYIYRMTSGNFIDVKKMNLVK